MSFNIKFKDYHFEYHLAENSHTIIFGNNGIGKTRLLEVLYDYSREALIAENYNVERTNLGSKEILFDESEVLSFGLNDIDEVNFEGAVGVLVVYTSLLDLCFKSVDSLKLNRKLELNMLEIPFEKHKIYKLFKEGTRNDTLVYELLRTLFESKLYRRTLEQIDTFRDAKKRKLTYELKNNVKELSEAVKYLLELIKYNADKNIELEFHYSKYRIEYERAIKKFNYPPTKFKKSNYTNIAKTGDVLKNSVFYLPTKRIAREYIQNDFLERITDMKNMQKFIFSNSFNVEKLLEELDEFHLKLSGINNALTQLKTGLTIFMDEGIIIEKKGQKIPFEYLSSGETSIVMILFTAYFCKEKYLLIDELDLAFTFEWQIAIIPILLRILENNEKILITTSHSPLVFSELQEINKNHYNVEVINRIV